MKLKCVDGKVRCFKKPLLIRDRKFIVVHHPVHCCHCSKTFEKTPITQQKDILKQHVCLPCTHRLAMAIGPDRLLCIVCGERYAPRNQGELLHVHQYDPHAEADIPPDKSNHIIMAGDPENGMVFDTGYTM